MKTSHAFLHPRDHLPGVDGSHKAMVSKENPPQILGSGQERRRTPRYKAPKGSLLGFLSASHEDNQGDGMLVDLSKAGCRITSEVPLTINQYYRLVLHPLAGQRVTIETAMVCWHAKSMYGLKFITVGEDQEEVLEQTLLQLRSLS